MIVSLDISLEALKFLDEQVVRTKSAPKQPIEQVDESLLSEEGRAQRDALAQEKANAEATSSRSKIVAQWLEQHFESGVLEEEKQMLAEHAKLRAAAEALYLTAPEDKDTGIPETSLEESEESASETTA